MALAATILAATVPAPVGAAPAPPAGRTGADAGPGSRGDLLPVVSTGVGIGLAFDSEVHHPATQLAAVDYVWGASQPSGAGGYDTAYLTFDRDDTPSGLHSLAWWKANDPTWVEYRCDRTTPAWEFGDPNVPLDITDPAVQSYQWNDEVGPLLAQGYAGIAFDNLDLTNGSGRCGHYDASGDWVQQFTGTAGDPAYTDAVLAWAAAARAEVHALSPTATMSINFSYDPDVSPADDLQLMDDADLVFDERGVSDWGTRGADRPTPALWADIVASALAIQQSGTCYDQNDEFPGPTARIPVADRLWAVANVLLVLDRCTYVSISGFRDHGTEQDYGRLHLFPEEEAAVGTPLGPATEASSGAWVRPFTTGVAVVNPTLTAATVGLPAGSWVDGQGGAVGPTLTLGPQSGDVLVAAP